MDSDLISIDVAKSFIHWQTKFAVVERDRYENNRVGLNVNHENIYGS